MYLLTLGLNHSTAPLETREQLAFPTDIQRRVLRSLVNGDYGVKEAAILCTCNRSEIYAVSPSKHGIDGLRRYLSSQHGIDLSTVSPCLYDFSDGNAALHLFRVACGIDSLVIGESQILGQVREALERAQQAQTAHMLINEVFQRALKVGKRARSETDIGRGRLSVSSAAVELAGQIFKSLENCSALLIGAGEMIELAARYLVDDGIAKIFVTNRTFQRAQELSQHFGGDAIPFDDLGTQLQQVDIAISSTAAPKFVISNEMVRNAMHNRRGRPLLLIDIAVPRDVDPSSRNCDNLFLFDMDDLERVVSANRKEREEAIRHVEEIVSTELGDFMHWLNARSTGPLVKSLKRRSEDLRQEELNRWMAKLNHLSEEDRETIDAVLRGYANKLLHHPLVEIRKLAGEKNGSVRLETVRRLFGLDNIATSNNAEDDPKKGN